MKNIYFIFSLLAILLNIVKFNHCQAQSSNNYYVIVDSLDKYFDANPALKIEDDGDYARYIRWKMFWHDRVYGGDSTKRGSFQLFSAAVNEYRDHLGYFQRSTLIGSDWHCLGPDNFTASKRGLVSAIYIDSAADKNLNTIFIGTNASGIWKTTNGGLNWHNVTDPTGITLLGITDITGDPTNGNVIYAATGFFCSDLLHSGGIGIIKSYDGGVTWQQIMSLNQVQDLAVYRILVDPTDSQRIYALVDSVVVRNNNAGIGVWDTIFKCPDVVSGERRKLRDILMKPMDNTTLYVASDDRKPDAESLCKAKVYKITNATSTNLANIHVQSLDEQFIAQGDTMLTQRFQIAVTPLDTSAVFVGCQQIVPQGSSTQFKFKLWKYDNINHWKPRIDLIEDQVPSLQGISWDKIEILVSTLDTGIVYVGGIFWNKFLHGQLVGNNMNHMDSIHVDIRCSKILKITLPDSSKHDAIYCGHDGGFSKSIGGIANWVNLCGNGLVITEFWGIGGANKRPDRVYCGAQDNSFFRYNAGAWHLSSDGDNGNPVVDQVCPDTLFVPYWVNGGVIRSKDGGMDLIPPNIEFVFENSEYHIPNSPIAINPQNHKSIYIGYHNLWKSVHYGDTGSFFKIQVTPVDSTGNNDGIRALAIAPRDSATIYLAYDGPINSSQGYQHKKLFRSKNNGQSWTDLTSSLGSLLHKYGITSIEVSPTNPDSLWIAFGGFWNDPAHHRVLVSSDSGSTRDTSANYSAGLPNSPVNCIKYMNGSNGRLFAATDEGVFYRDKYVSEWQPFNTGLPVCMVTDLEINDNTQKIRAGTFGRGLYETDLTCNYNSIDWVISGNVTINSDTAVDQSIVIDSSYTLTVKKKLKLPPEAAISVRPGARLIVDGGTLTNRCYSMWRGVEIGSHSNLQQNASNQGCANFIHGAVIENARFGVSTNGGLIVADSAYFRNNYGAVKFEYYPYNQASSFKRATFETTRNYLDTNYSVPQDFVSLCSVKGVSFRGCTFQNTTVPANCVPGSLKGRGIYSIDASYTVDRYEYTPTIFKGLYYGIRVYNSDPTRYVQIQHSTFDHNYRGIYLGSSNYSTVTENTFLVPNHTQAGNDTCYGLYLGTCSGYHIEANNFSSPGNTLLQSGSLTLREIGLIVDNSGGSPNEIYRNYFDSLDVAINAQRVNRQDGGAFTNGPVGNGIPYPNGNPSGLVIKCNTFNNNSYDEMATRYYTSGLEGIAKYQGGKTNDCKDQAGNSFSPYHAQVQIPESDIRNLADNFIYFHQNPATGYRIDPTYHTQVPKVVDSLVNKDFSYSSCCPSKLTSGKSGTYDLKRQMVAEINVIDSLVTLLKNIVDGGETNDLNSTITNSSPPDALDVQQNLLNSSPYLSDTVMKSAIAKENVLPNEMIRDVLVANPQSARSDDVLNTLNDRSIPMPDSLMADIMDGMDKLSPKEELEAELAIHMQNYKNLYNSLILFYKTDSVCALSCDSLVTFLGSIVDLDGKYLLAFEELLNGDTTTMNSTLNSITQSFTLDRFQQKQYQDYITYFNFLKGLKSPDKDILMLDSTRISQLGTLYSTMGEPVSSYIRGILIANGSLSYIEPIIIPEDTKSAPDKIGLKTSHFKQGVYLKLFPNPAHKFVIAEYKTTKERKDDQQILLSIASNEGKLIESRILYKSQDQVLIITSSYKPGNYICYLRVAGKVIASKIFTVIQ